MVGGRRPSPARPGLRVAQWPPEAADVVLVADADQVLLPYPAQPSCSTNPVQRWPLLARLVSLERAVWCLCPFLSLADLALVGNRSGQP